VLSCVPRGALTVLALTLTLCLALTSVSDAGLRAFIIRPDTGCADAGLVAETAGQAGRAARATLCVINERRFARGLRPLRANRALAVAARRHGTEMVGRRYFAHTARDGSTVDQRVQRTSYLPPHRVWTLGENLGWGIDDKSTPTAIVDAWMNSPRHREILLDPWFRDGGVGVVAGAPVASFVGRSATTYALAVGRIHALRR